MYKTPSEAKMWFRDLLDKIPQSKAEAALMVSYTSLPYASEILEGNDVYWGAQDVSAHLEGAYTGEVSVKMLSDLYCKYTVIGHSERRQYHAESDALIATKAKNLLSLGIIPIVCAGEPLEIREAGTHVEYTLAQLAGSLEGIELASPDKLVIAYEPVWAIGTGKTATPDQAESAHLFIRKWVANQCNSQIAESLQILYGGSVKPDNAAELMGQPNVDGALVGGASLKADQFLPIAQAAAVCFKG